MQELNPGLSSHEPIEQAIRPHWAHAGSHKPSYTMPLYHGLVHQQHVIIIENAFKI